MIVGSILVIIGIVFLLQNLGIILGGAWSIIWPALLVAAGINLILKRKDDGFFWEERVGWGRRKNKEKETE